MSFFDETKNFGLMAMVAGLMMILSALLGLTDGLSVPPVGVLIGGLLLLIFGLGAYGGVTMLNIGSLFDQGVTSKFGLVVGFVILIGIVELLQGVFSVEPNPIVIGVVLILFGILMKMNISPVLNNVIWAVLLIAFLIGIVLEFYALLGVFNGEALEMFFSALKAVAYLIMYIMLFTFVLSPEVKKKMSL